MQVSSLLMGWNPNPDTLPVPAAAGAPERPAPPTRPTAVRPPRAEAADDSSPAVMSLPQGCERSPNGTDSDSEVRAETVFCCTQNGCNGQFTSRGALATHAAHQCGQRERSSAAASMQLTSILSAPALRTQAGAGGLDQLEPVSSGPVSPVIEPGDKQQMQAAPPLRPARASCVDCLQTPKTTKSMTFVECTSMRCNMLASEPEPGALSEGKRYCSSRKRNRMCTRCLTEQYAYSTADLEQAGFTCPYCRNSGSEGGAHPPTGRGFTAVGTAQKRRRGNSLGLHEAASWAGSAAQVSGRPPPPLESTAASSDPGPADEISTTEGDDEGEEDPQRQWQRHRGNMSPIDDASQLEAAAAAPRPVLPPPHAESSEDVLGPLRRFLDETASGAGFCRVTVGAVISALDKAGAGGTAAIAMSGLEHLRVTKEISIRVDEEPVPSGSVTSLLRLRLLALKNTWPKLEEGDRVMVQAHGNIWMAARVVQLAGGGAQMRYDGMGKDFDEWQPERTSARLKKVGDAEIVRARGDARTGMEQGWEQDREKLLAGHDDDDDSLLFSSDEEGEEEEYDTAADDSMDATSSAPDQPLTTGIPSPEATAAEESAALAAAAVDLPYPVGTIVEALDLADKWFAARLVKVDLRKFGNQPRKKRVLVHFIGWGTEWDEWFDLNNPTQGERLRPLCPTTMFGPYFHTMGQPGFWKAAFAGENYIARVRYVLEAVGDGQSIGFDSLVRAVYEISARMRPDEAMKIVRRVAKVLEELREEDQNAIRWTSPIGLIDVLNIMAKPAGSEADGEATVGDTGAACQYKYAAAFRGAVGEMVEVLDGTMEWFLATVIELPTKRESTSERASSPLSGGGEDKKGDWEGGSNSRAHVVSVTDNHLGYARCRFVGWSAEWDIWVPASTESGDLPRIRKKTPNGKKKLHVAAAGGGAHMAAGVEVGGEYGELGEEEEEEEVQFSPNQRDAVFKEVANIVFGTQEVEARMRRMTRQTTKTDEEAIGTTRAEDVPIEVMDTHTIKNLGAFARHDIQDGAFIGEYAGEVLLLSTVRKRKSEYLFNLGSGLTIDASRIGNSCRFMNHSNDGYKCNVSAMIVNHRGTRRVVFHAKRLIHHGEEMMYDYGEDFAKNIGKRLI